MKVRMFTLVTIAFLVSHLYVNGNGLISRSGVKLLSSPEAYGLTETKSQTGDAGNDQTVCSTTASLSATGVGVWTTTGTAYIRTPTDPASMVDNLSYGANVFLWTLNGGASSQVTIYNYLPSVYAGPEQHLCSSSATLTANVPSGSGQWTIVSGSGSISAPLDYRSQITGVAQGLTLVRWTVTDHACSASSDVRIYNDIPSIATAEQNIHVCCSNVQLHAVRPLIGQGYWSTGSALSFDVNDPSAYVSGLTNATTDFTWTVSKGQCSNSVNVSVVSDRMTFANTDQTVCGTTASLPAAQPNQGPGVWTSLGQAVLAAPNQMSTQVSNLKFGSNVFRWTPQTGVAVLVNIYNKKEPALAGEAKTACGYVVLDANLPTNGGGQWSLVNGAGTVVYVNDPKSEVRGLAIGNNVFRWTINHDACSTSSDVSITNLQVPTTASTTLETCSDHASLTALSPSAGLGYWQGIETPAIIENSLNPSSAFSKLRFGNNSFVWRVDNQGCFSDSYFSIINKMVVAEAGASYAVCGDVATLNAVVPAAGVANWSVVGGNAVVVYANSVQTPVVGLSLGINRFRWTVVANGCTGSSETIISNDNTTLTNAGADATVCEPSQALSANVPSRGTGFWTIVSGSGVFANSLLPNTSVANLAPGSNVFKWTVINNACSSFDQVVLLNDRPSVAQAGASVVTCSNTAMLNAVPPAKGIGAWTVYSGNSVVTYANQYSSSVVNLTPGTNVFKWTVTYNSCSSNSFVTIVNDAPSVASVTSTLSSVCSSSVNLGALLPLKGVGKWSLVSGAGIIANTAQASTAVTNLASGNNAFRWTVVNNACSSTAMAYVINDSPSVAEVSKTAFSVCTASAVLNGIIPAKGSAFWSLIGGNATITNPSLNNSTLTNLGLGVNTFRWTVTYNACSSSVELNIINDSPSVANVTNTFVSVCANSAGVGAISPSKGIGQWSMIAGSGTIINSSLPTTDIINLGLGNNAFRWTVTNNACSSFATVYVVNNTTTIANAGSSAEVCTGAVNLNANLPQTGQGAWSLSSGAAIIANPTSNLTSVTKLALGLNKFSWTIVKANCSSTSEVQILNNQVSVAEASASLEVCCGSVMLNALPPVSGTGVWTTLGPAIIEKANMPSTKAVELSPGINQFTWTVTKGICRSQVLLNVSNKALLIPNYDFTISGNTVSFIDRSQGLPDKYSWDFGNGDRDSVASPTHTFSKEGLYSISLAIKKTSTGMVNMITKTIAVGTISNLISDFSFNKLQGTTIQFTDNSKGAPSNYLWDFGDGETVSSVSPTHVYAKSGDYLVCLFVSDPSRKLQDGACKMLTAGAESIQADFAFFADLNKPTVFTNHSIGSANKWFWSFGDGQYTNEPNPSHQFAMAGSYQVCLAALDTIKNIRSYSCKEVVIKTPQLEAPLLARFSYIKKQGTDSILFVSETSGTYTHLSWSFGDGAVAFGENVSHLYTKMNTYNVCLSVYDKARNLYADVCNKLEFKLSATNLLSDFSYYINAARNELVLNDLSKGSPDRWRWSFGDGATDTTSSPKHTFAKNGLFRVCLTTSNRSTGAYSEKCADVTINKPNLISLNPEFSYLINPQDSTLVFSVQSSGNANKWNWSFGNGQYAQTDHPTVKYTRSGVYKVCLQVKDTLSKAIGEKCKELDLAWNAVNSNLPVEADFVFFAETAKPIVTFRNASRGLASNWYWTFGDGLSGEGETFTHAYKEGGIYNACLNVYDQKSNKYSQICRPVLVGNAQCSVESDFSFFVDDKTKSVNFFNQSRGDAGKYFWSFGDGGTSTESNPNHIYQDAKSFRVNLSVSDANRTCFANRSKTIEISNSNCVADFRFAVNAKSKTVTLFQNAIGEIKQFAWDFGDGTYGEGESIVHAYPENGSYKVSLKVKAQNACIDEGVKELQVGDIACNASFDYYIDSLTNTFAAHPIALGNTSNYYWDFGDGANSKLAKVEHRYQAAAFYTIGLTAKTADGSCMDYKEVTLLVGNRKNDVQAEFIAHTDKDGATVVFTNQSIGDNLRYIWNFNDKTTSTDKNPSPHQYARNGYYNVCLTAIGNQKSRNMVCKEIRVAKPDSLVCHSRFYFDVDVDALKANFFNQSIGKPDRFEWDFGDGVKSSDRNPSHVYAQAGFYLVSLRATNTSSTSTNTSYQLINLTQGDDFASLFTVIIAPKTNKAQGYPIDVMGAAHGKPALKVWDFGDGTKDSTSATPNHVYANPGTYIVTYTVIDPVTGKSATSSQTVVITGLNEDYALNESTNIYPNPSQGSFTLSITGDEAKDYSIEIVNAQSQVVFRDELQRIRSLEKKYEKNFDRGLYLVRIRSANKYKTLKLIVK